LGWILDRVDIVDWVDVVDLGWAAKIAGGGAAWGGMPGVWGHKFFLF
jgi:hypothetical protein